MPPTSGRRLDVSHTDRAEHEESFVRAFVVPAKRQRLVELLSKPKRRKNVLDTLAHFTDLDPRFQIPIPSFAQSAPAIEGLLRGRGAPGECYVISESAALDGRFLALAEALRLIVGQGMGTLLSCIPGRLGYYEGEGPEDRCLLERGSLEHS
jgi:hypothetical protein